MSQSITQVSPKYLKLVRKFPLRVMDSESQCDEAIEIIQSLAIRGKDDWTVEPQITWMR